MKTVDLNNSAYLNSSWGMMNQVEIVKLLKEKNNLLYTILKEKKVENEKYAFRCFLLRLGFIGQEYKTTRKVLMKNLEGNAAWKKK